MTTRRKFLQLLGLASAAPVVANAAVSELVTEQARLPGEKPFKAIVKRIHYTELPEKMTTGKLFEALRLCGDQGHLLRNWVFDPVHFYDLMGMNAAIPDDDFDFKPCPQTFNLPARVVSCKTNHGFPCTYGVSTNGMILCWIISNHDDTLTVGGGKYEPMTRHVFNA